jgi:hypothetical protein
MPGTIKQIKPIKIKKPVQIDTPMYHQKNFSPARNAAKKSMLWPLAPQSKV